MHDINKKWDQENEMSEMVMVHESILLYVYVIKGYGLPYDDLAASSIWLHDSS